MLVKRAVEAETELRFAKKKKKLKVSFFADKTNDNIFGHR